MEGRVMGIYIKGFKPQDGLYVIKDGVIRKYKGKGGTVRPYELVEVKEPNERGRAMDDAISRAGAIDALDRIFDRCEEIEAHLPEGDPDRTGYKMYPDYMTVWKYLRQLPSAQPEIIRCGQCKYAEVADSEDSQDGYTCQFHRGSIWFSGSYCSWAERRRDG